MIEVTYPWFPKELNPNTRCHWAVKSNAAKAYRKTGKLITQSVFAKNQVVFGQIKIHLFIDFYPPDRRRRDDDNCYSAIKSLRDGISDALGVNDTNFVGHPLLKDETVKGGKIKIRFRYNSGAATSYARVLLLCSYCDECADDYPCEDCLQLCSLAIVPKNTINVLGNFGVMKEQS
jgi:crossover junction endodeoxyribonuclease RusA